MAIIKNTIIDVSSVQVLDRLYVFETTPYEIEYDESVTRIYVVDECYDAFLELNPTAPLKTFNPEAIQAALPEWYEYVCVAIDEDSNSALLSLLYDNGLIENEDYATYAEIRAINSSQFADAFSSASSLTSFDEFELFTGVKKLGDYAFSGCPNMESIKFPESVYKLGKNVLAGCNSLENVEVDGNNAHFYSPEGSNLIVDKTTRTIVAGCGSSTIPSDVYYIGDYAFAGSNLTEITIPSNIREIGDHGFDGCSALEYVEMESENPPKIGDNVFDDVSEDFEIDVPEDAVETYTEDDEWSQYAEYINGGQPQPHPKDLSDDEFGLESDDITITNEQMPVIIPLVNTHDLPVTYASSDTSIATVDQTGAVTLSYDNGNTNITVSFAGNDEYKAKTLTYAVTVAIPQELSDAELSWSASSATATQTGTFTGVTLTNTHHVPVTFASSDENVASIEPTYGHIMVTADGTTVISAAFAGNAQYKAKTVTYTLTVALAQDLTDQEFGLSSSSTTISTEGATVTLPVINIYNLPVTYTTSNNVVATVDENGNVTLSYVDGVALISIAFAGNSTYKAKTLIYTITVDMPAQIEHVMHTTFTVSQAQVGTDTKLMRDEAHMSYFNSMIIDNVEMPVTYTYNFSTAGEHSVDYKIIKSNPDLPRTLFNGINQLNTCYMPDGITAVRYQTFFNNTGVSYISVPNGVTSLEAQSFRGTTHLQTVYLPDTVAHINTASFKSSGIESIRIPTGVTQLISNSFESCNNLTYIEIPATVTTIDSQVFYKCSNLATVVSYNTTPPALNAQAFADTALNAIYVPFDNVPDYQAANNWSTYASIIQPIGGKHTLTDAEFGLSSSSATITNSGSMSNYLVNTHNLPVTYSSSDSTVLTVDANGDLTVVADGSATITVSFAGNGQYLPKTLTFSATCAVQAVYPVRVTFDITNSDSYLYDHSWIMKPSGQQSDVDSIKVDGVELNEIPSDGKYVFSSAGEHIVEYSFNDNVHLGIFCDYPTNVFRNIYKNRFSGSISSDVATCLEVKEGVTSIDEDTLKGCYVDEIILPSTLTTINGWSSLTDISKITKMVVKATTPPTANDNILNGYGVLVNNSTGDKYIEYPYFTIFVPDESVDLYKQAHGWSTFNKYIKGISEYPNTYKQVTIVNKYNSSGNKLFNGNKYLYTVNQ